MVTEIYIPHACNNIVSCQFIYTKEQNMFYLNFKGKIIHGIGILGF